jgi:ATP-binding cassette, subfamily B, bacterial MsbA
LKEKSKKQFSQQQLMALFKQKYKDALGYLIPYKWNVLLNFLFNALQIIFSLFSLLMIIPFLQVLFEKTKLTGVRPEPGLSGDALSEWFNFYLSQIIIEEGKSQALLFVSLFVVVMILFKNIFLYLSKYFLVNVRNGVVKDIRNNIYRKVLHLPFSYFSEERKGDIISRMTNDIKEVEWTVISSIELLFRNPMTILFYLGALFYMSPSLTGFVLIMVGVAGFIIGRVGRSLKKSSKEAQDKMGTLLSTIEETLSGLRVIKAFNAERIIKNRFEGQNMGYTKTMNRVYRKNYLASPMSEFLGVLVLVTVMYYGGSMVLGNESVLSPEAFIGYIGVFSQIINPAKTFSTAMYNINKGMASIDRINDVMRAKNTITEKNDAKTIEDFSDAVEYKDVSFSYVNDERVLKNINLRLEKGKSLALVGESGSGKSTIADLLPRFYDVKIGEILIDGINIKDYRIKDLRSLMGNVNQEPILFNDTIYNNITFGTEGVSEADVIQAAKIANAHDFITASEKGYQTNIGDSGSKLSGGQRQRLSIARAVLKNPPIMILDEATSSLDTESEQLVQEALNNLMKQRTSLIIAHRLSTVKNADKICVISKGEIIEEGTHDELMQLGGAYKRLYELQIF